METKEKRYKLTISKNGEEVHTFSVPRILYVSCTSMVTVTVTVQVTESFIFSRRNGNAKDQTVIVNRSVSLKSRKRRFIFGQWEGPHYKSDEFVTNFQTLVSREFIPTKSELLTSLLSKIRWIMSRRQSCRLLILTLRHPNF